MFLCSRQITIQETYSLIVNPLKGIDFLTGNLSRSTWLLPLTGIN